MLEALRLRFLARQFARPSGIVGRWLVAPWLDRIGRTMNEVAFRQLGAEPGLCVLEVGFGGGSLAVSLLQAGAEVVGVDRSEAVVARARRRFRGEIERGRARFLVGSAESLPIGAAAVDLACSVNAVYFWPELHPVLREFARVVRPGGALVLCFQTPDAVRRWPGYRFGFHAHEPDDVARAMTEAGFRLGETVYGSGAAVGGFVCMRGERL
jgi:ubiquinone/menaquinone biosynthesis C-methylase UbiE